MKSILDPSFRYTPSMNTDIRKTFERIRHELQRHAVTAAGHGERNGSVLALQRQSAVSR